MTWEYRTIVVATHGFMGGKVDENEISSQLNELGRDRWEVAAAFATAMGSGESRDIVVILKRQR